MQLKNTGFLPSADAKPNAIRPLRADVSTATPAQADNSSAPDAAASTSTLAPQDGFQRSQTRPESTTPQPSSDSGAMTIARVARLIRPEQSETPAQPVKTEDPEGFQLLDFDDDENRSPSLAPAGTGATGANDTIAAAESLQAFAQKHFATLSGGDGFISAADLLAARRDKRFDIFDQRSLQILQAYVGELQDQADDGADNAKGISLKDISALVAKVKANPETPLFQDLTKTFTSSDAKANQLDDTLESRFFSIDQDGDGVLTHGEIDQEIERSMKMPERNQNEPLRAALVALRAQSSEIAGLSKDADDQGVSLRDLRAYRRQSADTKPAAAVRNLTNSLLDKAPELLPRDVIKLVRERFGELDSNQDDALSPEELNKALADSRLSGQEKAIVARMLAFQPEIGGLTDKGDAKSVHRQDIYQWIRDTELKPTDKLARQTHFSTVNFAMGLAEYNTRLKGDLNMPAPLPQRISEPTEVENYAFKGIRQNAKRYQVTIDGQKIDIYEPNPLPKDTRLSSVQDLAKALGSLPPALRGKIKEMRINPLPNPNDAKPTPEDPNPGVALMSAGGGEVTVYPAAGPNSVLGLYATLIHEGAHNFDDNWSEAQKKAWQDAMDQDVISPSIYARKSAREDFAETASLYYLSKGTDSYNQLKQDYPARFALMEKLGL